MSSRTECAMYCRVCDHMVSRAAFCFRPSPTRRSSMIASHCPSQRVVAVIAILLGWRDSADSEKGRQLRYSNKSDATARVGCVGPETEARYASPEPHERPVGSFPGAFGPAGHSQAATETR